MTELKFIEAECPTCGKQRFRATGESLQPGDILTCESCGLKLSYAFLQSRLGGAQAPEQRALPAAKRAKKRKAAKSRTRKRA